MNPDSVLNQRLFSLVFHPGFFLLLFWAGAWKHKVGWFVYISPPLASGIHTVPALQWETQALLLTISALWGQGSASGQHALLCDLLCFHGTFSLKGSVLAINPVPWTYSLPAFLCPGSNRSPELAKVLLCVNGGDGPRYLSMWRQTCSLQFTGIFRWDN